MTGTPEQAVVGEVRRRSWEQLAHGLWVPHAGRNRFEDLRAWQLLLPVDAGFTHLTSAAVRGWWLPTPLPYPIFAAMPETGDRFRRPGLIVSRHPHPPDIVVWQGLRVTSAADTLLHAARDLALLDLVVLGDSALRLGQVTISELQRVARLRRRGVRQLRRLIPLLDRRSESAWESVMRVLHQAAGIPVTPQYKIYDEYGDFVARADLRIDGTRRLQEYDGSGHRDKERHRVDLGRERSLLRTRWERAGYTSSDLLTGGAAIIADADRTLGRDFESSQLAAWNAMIAESLHTPAGRARVWRRWRCTNRAQTPTPSRPEKGLATD